MPFFIIILFFALLLRPALACEVSGVAAPQAQGRSWQEPTLLHAPLCLPASPRRIVVLDTYYTLGMGLELGLPIVGAPLFGMQNAKLKAEAEAADVVDIGHAAQPSLERIVALKPDLILGDAAMHGRIYQSMARIAPTALVNVQNWRNYYMLIADLAGRQSTAIAAFKAFDARVAEVKARAPSSTVSVLRIIPGGFQVYVDGPGAYAPFSILHDAGVKRSAYETVLDDTTLKRPDWEQLDRLDGSLLLYIVGGGNDTDPSGRLEREVTSNPLWQLIPAVAAGRAYQVNAVSWMEFSGLASANAILDDVERHILARP